jgi:hypothetical protein
MGSISMPMKWAWIIAAALVLVGISVLCGCAYFFRALPPTYAVVLMVGGAGVAAVGGLLLFRQCLIRYGGIHVPTWLGLLILLLLLATLLLAAILT